MAERAGTGMQTWVKGTELRETPSLQLLPLDMTQTQGLACRRPSQETPWLLQTQAPARLALSLGKASQKAWLSLPGDPQRASHLAAQLHPPPVPGCDQLVNSPVSLATAKGWGATCFRWDRNLPDLDHKLNWTRARRTEGRGL